MRIIFPIILIVVALTVLFLPVRNILIPSVSSGDDTAQTLESLSVEELDEKRKDLNDALTSAKEVQKQREELEKKYRLISQADKERLEKLLPAHVDNVRLVLDLDSIARKYGMTVRNVLVKTEDLQGESLGPSLNAYTPVVMSFNVSGNYFAIREFLSNLERSLRIVDVIGLSFNQDQTGQYTFAVTLRAYYWLNQ